MFSMKCLLLGDDGAADSLLDRARCYVLLGQRKTAIFDFCAILKEQPRHVEALCGRGFTFLMLKQQKVFLTRALREHQSRSSSRMLLPNKKQKKKGSVSQMFSHLNIFIQ